MKILANSKIQILFEIRMCTETHQTLIVFHLTQQSTPSPNRNINLKYSELNFVFSVP
jgi:hypothetical protein